MICPACDSNQVTAISFTVEDGKNRECQECNFRWTSGGRKKRQVKSYPRNALKQGKK